MPPRLPFSALLSAALVAGAFADDSPPGIPVFSDDFSVPALFAENWDASKSARCENGRAVIPAGHNMTLRRVPAGDFAFAADIVVEKPESKLPGHFGVKLDGWINLLITPSRKRNAAVAHTAYRVRGEKRSRGNSGGLIPGFRFGKPVRILVSREKVGEGHKYSYRVNGRPVDSFVVADREEAGTIMLYGYRTSLSVDNFQLYALKGTGSRNLVVNSSFEHLQEGRPLYMRPATARKLRFEGQWEAFMHAFAIDTEEKVSGHQAARMTMDRAFPGAEHLSSLPSRLFRNGVWTHNVSVVLGKPVTFSVYLKASEDGFPVKLIIWELWYKGHSKGITVSKEWQRYSFTLQQLERKSIVRGIASFSHPGTLWADDLQIEVGGEATDYLPSSLDKEKFADAKQAVAVERETVLTRTDAAPVIDGDIEETWFENGARVDKFFVKGWGTPQNKTEAWLTCDADHLYLAVRAHVPNVSRVRGETRARDDLTVHTEDCIEVFLDTTFGRKEYYHLTVNAAGSRTDMGPGRMVAWNGEWAAAARINADGGSIDYEMQFPLQNFAGLEMAEKWGLNIGRNDTISQEFPSLTHVTELNFHVPAIFPAVVFPKGTVDKYKVGVRDLCLVAGRDGALRVSGTIGNLSGETLDAEIRIADAKTGKTIGGGARKLRKGSAELSLPVAAGPEVDALEVVVEVVVSGKKRYSQQKRVALARPLELYTRYNYYMNERAAVLVGTLNLPDADKLTGRVTVAGRTFDVGMAPQFAIDIPLAGIGNGKHEVTLEVQRGAETLARGSTRLVKRAFKEGATQIDRQRRCLVVDGKPYLVIAPFFGMEPALAPAHEAAVLPNMLRLHKDMGYRCFHVIAKDDPPVPRQTQAFYELCAREDIKIIHWAARAWNTRDTPAKRFEIVKSDNIIAWMIIDEPELGSRTSEEVEKFLLSHQAANPYAPVFMNNSILGIPRRYANLETDILMLDDYLTNRENRKVAEMVDAADMMMEAGREGRKPVFYFLAGENLGNHYREPTYAEQVAQTYGVIIAGARGVSYFCSLPYYPEHYRALVDVNRELLALEDAIFSLEPTSQAAIANPIVRQMTRRLGDKLYVIALNIDNDRPAEIETVLPPEFAYGERAQVAFEDRSVKVERGRILDRFKPLERHVYVIEGSED